jgi:hypothetical protein
VSRETRIVNRAMKQDIVKKLLDFEHWGNTATERFTVRIEAADEIKRLRSELERETERAEVALETLNQTRNELAEVRK